MGYGIKLQMAEGGRRERETEITFQEIMARYFPNMMKFDENCEPLVPRILMNPKPQKHEENHIKTHHNQTAQKQR